MRVNNEIRSFEIYVCDDLFTRIEVTGELQLATCIHDNFDSWKNRPAHVDQAEFVGVTIIAQDSMRPLDPCSPVRWPFLLWPWQW